MATTKISICSSALLMIGDDEITSLPGSTRRGKVCANIYDITRDVLFQSHPWRFATGQRKLSKLVDTPLFSEFANVFQLPSDFKRLIRTEDDSSFKIYENKIYSNQDVLNIEYEFVVLESDFPSYFVRTLELKMSSILSAAISEDATKVQLFDRMYNDQFRAAKAADNQSKITDSIRSNNLTSVRNSSIG